MSGIRVCALLVWCIGCGGSSAGPTRIGHAAPRADPAPASTTAAPPPRAMARVRLVHAAVESRDLGVTIVADGADQATIDRTGYEFASAYAEVPIGDHALSARSDERELISASISLVAGASTLIAYSTADFPIALSLAPDAASPPDADTAHVRFFHAIVGQAAIDACIAPETARGDVVVLAADIAPGTFGDASGAYASAAGGALLAIQLRARDAVPCHGRALGVARFTPASGSHYTLIAVGRTRGRRVPLELIFCADPPATDTSCATVTFAAH